MALVKDLFWGEYAFTLIDDNGHDRDYFAEVGTDGIYIVKHEYGSTDAEWALWVWFTMPMKQDGLTNEYTIPTGQTAHDAKGGKYASGQTLVLFLENEYGPDQHAFLVAVDETMAPDMMYHPINSMKFQLFKHHESTPSYAAPKSPAPGTPKTAPMPSPYSNDLSSYVPGMPWKLSFDDKPDAPSTSASNTPLLLGVGLMVVAVGFYGMRR
jgi:hypothetical protein